MSTLHPSPPSIHRTFPSPPSIRRTFPSPPSISSSLHLPSPLKSPLPRRRRHSSSAAGATMLDSPATSYAAALSSLAQSNNTLDATLSDLSTLKTVFSNPPIQSFFANPTFPDAAKIDLINQIAASSDLQPHTLNFLFVLLDMKRIDLVDEIVKEFEACYDEITGTTVAVVSSVVGIEPQQLSLIARTVQRLTGARNVRIKTEIDEELVAGFTIRFGNSGSKFVDLSVRKQLEEIKGKLDLSGVVLGG